MSMMVLVWLVPVSLAVVLLVVATSGKVVFLKPRTYAEAATGLLLASLPFTLVTPFTFITKTVFIVLQLMLVLLAARLLFGRLPKEFIYPSTRANVFIVFGVVVAICCGWLLAVYMPGILGNYEWRWVMLVSVAMAAQVLFLAQLLWSFRHYSLHLTDTKRTLKELPTVSVCIPARNEDHALEDCLVSVLASTYPKLEVLVLDDCSQDKTSQIVRSFAHDGVRFIQGEPPSDSWLGKNQAMQTLAEQATGDFILFTDVDTRLSTTSIAQLINYTLDTKMEMVAILPQDRLSLQPGALFGTLRYFWQMVLPITRHRVPVAGQAWLMNANKLRDLGSFKSVAHKVVPQGRFARQLATQGTYRFIASSSGLGITTAKKWSSLVESALRVLYPTYHRQPVAALGVILAIGVLQLAPMVLAVWLLAVGGHTWLLLFCGLTSALIFVNYALVLQRSHPRSWFIGMLLLPFVVVQEAALILVSMLKYEFGEVTWKGRNICYPVILSERSQRAGQALRQLHR
jgi:chlorobactene glucosyltransferase